jgi:alpha-beta hydrolase superfamily lysophospholipase
MTNEFDEQEPRDFAMLDRPEVSRVLFHPRHEIPNRTIPLRVRSFNILVAEGISVSGRLYRSNPNGPIILLFHGNGEIASDYDGMSPLYTNLGINLLVVDYRGYGSSNGQPAASNLLTDAVQVFQKVDPIIAQHGLQSQPLFIMGRSLGSAAAIEIAHRSGDEIAGLIIESGFAYTFPLLVTLGLRMELDGVDETRDGFGNLAKIAQVQAPTLVIHGQDDQLIPVANGQALYEHCDAADKRLVTIPRAGHNDLLFTGRHLYFEALQTFVLGN